MFFSALPVTVSLLCLFFWEDLTVNGSPFLKGIGSVGRNRLSNRFSLSSSANSSYHQTSISIPRIIVSKLDKFSRRLLGREGRRDENKGVSSSIVTPSISIVPAGSSEDNLIVDIDDEASVVSFPGCALEVPKPRPRKCLTTTEFIIQYQNRLSLGELSIHSAPDRIGSHENTSSSNALFYMNREEAGSSVGSGSPVPNWNVLLGDLNSLGVDLLPGSGGVSERADEQYAGDDNESLPSSQGSSPKSYTSAQERDIHCVGRDLPRVQYFPGQLDSETMSAFAVTRLLMNHVINRKKPYFQGMHQIAAICLEVAYRNGVEDEMSESEDGSGSGESSPSRFSDAERLFITITDGMIDDFDGFNYNGLSNTFSAAIEQLQLDLGMIFTEEELTRANEENEHNDDIPSLEMMINTLASKASFLFLDVVPLSFQWPIIFYYMEDRKEAIRGLLLAFSVRFMCHLQAPSSESDQPIVNVKSLVASFNQYEELISQAKLNRIIVQLLSNDLTLDQLRVEQTGLHKRLKKHLNPDLNKKFTNVFPMPVLRWLLPSESPTPSSDAKFPICHMQRYWPLVH